MHAGEAPSLFQMSSDQPVGLMWILVDKKPEF
jgi:hypothetical protein